MLQCSRCKSILYCSENCQRQHWPKHRNLCKTIEMMKKLEQEANYVAPVYQVYPSHLSPRQHTRVAQLVGNKCSINCHLDGQAVTALWDTGAQVSIVSETFMHKQSLTSKLRNVEELLGN